MSVMKIRSDRALRRRAGNVTPVANAPAVLAVVVILANARIHNRCFDGRAGATGLPADKRLWLWAPRVRGGDDGVQSGVSSPSVQASRSLNFWILPEPVSGKALTTNQCFGVLCGASAARM